MFKNKTSIPGMFALVLHSHLPYLAGYGTWPVGEEWLYQAWANSYLNIVESITNLLNQGFKDILTLSITPTLVSQLDNDYCLRNMYYWLGNWRNRCESALSNEPKSQFDYSYEFNLAQQAINLFESKWKNGGSSVFNNLATAEGIELLSGPITHSFQPLLPPKLRKYLLVQGLKEHNYKFSTKTNGIWAPECGYTPGMERDYQDAKIKYLVIDGPAVKNNTAFGYPIAASNVVAFPRNLNISYKVWSPTSGYPGHSFYRDFYAIDSTNGIKKFRVTDKKLAPTRKQPYQPNQTLPILKQQITEFVTHIKTTLINQYKLYNKPSLVLTAFDTELFGHWWHEGPKWIELLFSELNSAQIKFGSLNTAYQNGYITNPTNLGDISWGKNKDWHIWNGPKITAINTNYNQTITQCLEVLTKVQIATHNAPNVIADAVINQLLLLLASDWAFMISHNSSAKYAQERLTTHTQRIQELINQLLNNLTTQTFTDITTSKDIIFGRLDYREFLAQVK